MLYTSYVRSKLEFGSVIWEPYQEVYCDDLESVQKNFLMYLLSGTNKIWPHKLLPYEERCEKVGLDTFKNRRKQLNLIFAFDLFNNTMHDDNTAKKLVRAESNRVLRHEQLLLEDTRRNDYGYWQPIAKIKRLINENCDIFKKNLDKNSFKNTIKKPKICKLL